MTSQYAVVPTETIHIEEETFGKSLNIQTVIDKGPIFGKRHEQMLLLGFLSFLTSCIKGSMSISIVAMNDPTASNNPDVPTYNWTDKGTVLSGYFWGFMLPQLGSGWLTGRYGSKWILVGSTIVCSLLNFLLPTTANSFGFIGVTVCRVLQGFTQGMILPSTHGLIGKWIPPQERSSLGTLAVSGTSSGLVVITFTSAYLAASWYGWPLTFYLNGGLGILWSILFCYIGRNSPAEHPSITYEERFFIRNSLPSADKSKKLSTPWIKIMTSASFLTILFAQCAYNWGYLLLMIDTPSYFKNVMKFDIKKNGVMSMLPFIVKYVMAFVFSFTSDMFIAKGIWSIGTSRKIMHSIGTVGPCIALIFLAQCGPGDSYKAVVSLMISFGCLSANMSGVLFNHLDLSPNHASVLMGITSQLFTFCTAAGLTSVRFIVTDEEDSNQWGILFYFTAGIFILSTMIFCIFGSAEVQPWNDEIVKCKSSRKDKNKL